jgi:hypothetical protein
MLALLLKQYMIYKHDFFALLCNSEFGTHIGQLNRYISGSMPLSFQVGVIYNLCKNGFVVTELLSFSYSWNTTCFLIIIGHSSITFLYKYYDTLKTYMGFCSVYRVSCLFDRRFKPVKSKSVFFCQALPGA